MVGRVDNRDRDGIDKAPAGDDHHLNGFADFQTREPKTQESGIKSSIPVQRRCI
jgi:hypothetical protein